MTFNYQKVDPYSVAGDRTMPPIDHMRQKKDTYIGMYKTFPLIQTHIVYYMKQIKDIRDDMVSI